MNAPAARRIGWGLWALGVFSVALAQILLVLNGFARGDDLFFSTVSIAVVVGFATVGALVVARHPDNILGWLFLAIGTWFGLASLASQYAIRGLVVQPGSLPGAAAALWLTQQAIVWALGPTTLIFLLFPTGRVHSARWRWAPRIYVAALVLAFVGFTLRPGILTTDGGPPNASIPNPTAVDSVAWLAHVLLTASAIAAFAIGVLSVVSIVLRYRGAEGEERQQIRWLAYVAGTSLLTFAGLWLTEALTAGGALSDFLFILWVLTIALGIPIASGIAILKYRLYELEVVVKKTFVFAILAILITAVYVGVVVLVPVAIVGIGGSGIEPVPLLAALLVALAFQPLRERARRLADRIVYGRRATPYEVLSEFSESVAGTYSTDDVLPRMARVLGEGTGARTARVWLRVGDELRPSASWPPGAEVDGPLRIVGDTLPPLPPGEWAMEVRHQGEPLGALTVEMPASDPMDPAKEKLVRDLASQAGLVLRNVRLIEELRASRQRLVRAQDEERRRLERNIHDGAQQQLVALGVRLGLLSTLIRKDPEHALETADQLRSETQTALEDLRDLARGIYPPLLADRGLQAALEAQVRKSLVPVEIDRDSVDRYPQEVEAAVYFCVLEALQNVAKYARASGARLRLATGEGELRFEVADDGVGFDPRITRRGTGLQGMADRLEAVGGTLEVRSAPGSGTTVAGRVPVQEART